MMIPVLVRPLTARAVAATVLALALLCSSGTAWADRAVIVGVGEYANPEYNLPGIDRDIENARKIVTALGIPREQQKVVRDSQATAAQIKSAIRWALAAGPGERAFIYFSGHGTRAHDADGSIHSALVAHDYRPIGSGRADGVILGNWIGPQLGSSTAGLTVLLVDACESGTITKALWTGSDGQGRRSIVSKYVATPGAQGGPAQEAFFKIPARTVAAHWVVMTAVQENQLAPASPVGSPFTLALSSALASGDARLTARQLHEAVVEDLKVNRGIPVDSSPQGVNPQVWGSDESVLNTPLQSHPSGATATGLPRSRWTRLEQLVARTEPGALELSDVKEHYKVGEQLTLTLTLKRGGYLTLINVDREDMAAVIVPNRVLPQARLDAGTYVIPTDLRSLASQAFPIRAASPGEILLVALLTPQPLQLTTATAQKPMFTLLDERLLGLLEATKPPCPQGKGCKLFVADVGDAETAAPFVTRPEAISVRTAIVP